MVMEKIIDIKNLHFSYKRGQEILSIDSLEVEKGEEVFLYGPSGSGKSTLLGLITGVLQPGSGNITILGQRMEALNPAQKDKFRGNHIGYIFQMFNLIPFLSVIENICLPCKLNKRRHEQLGDLSLKDQVHQLASELSLTAFLNKKASELSVGQQQRVAVARAFIGKPELIIADEPTSSLDYGHKNSFLKLLFTECEKVGSTVVFVSHDLSLKEQFQKSIALDEINKLHTKAEVF